MDNLQKHAWKHNTDSLRNWRNNSWNICGFYPGLCNITMGDVSGVFHTG